jgi:hypothetical protein
VVSGLFSGQNVSNRLIICGNELSELIAILTAAQKQPPLTDEANIEIAWTIDQRIDNLVGLIMQHLLLASCDANV